MHCIGSPNTKSNSANSHLRVVTPDHCIACPLAMTEAEVAELNERVQEIETTLRLVLPRVEEALKENSAAIAAVQQEIRDAKVGGKWFTRGILILGASGWAGYAGVFGKVARALGINQ